VIDQAEKEPRHFDMIKIDPRVISVLAAQPRPSLLNQLEPDGKPPSPTIAIGDTVAVSIWQASNVSGLQMMQTTPESGASQAGTSVTLPAQVVGADGAISVPFAGRVPTAGRTPLEVQNTIEQRLAEQVVQPQAIVTVTKSVSNSVTVSGEQVAGERVPLSVGGDRLLDVIATAGGAKSPVYDTSILISRNGRTATIPMTTLVSDPQENIYAWPGDVITLEQTPKTFLVFGATSTNTQVPFGAARLDLAQAIAKAGGLLDLRADPEGVFLFRFEPPAVVNALGLPGLANQPGGDSPVLYHLNLRQVEGYFLADRFPIKDNDLIYVANASMTELQKFFMMIGSITGPVIGGVVVTQGVK
jgi:polysaccharide export outer membrane protein